jgi:hypothetical protein
MAIDGRITMVTSRLRQRIGHATLAASVLAVVAGGPRCIRATGSLLRSPKSCSRRRKGVGSFDGFGVQFKQHVYADISGPSSNLRALERDVLAFRGPFVRIFFNTTEWTFPNRMASFARDGRARTPLGCPDQHHLAGQRCSVRADNMSRFADVLAGQVVSLGIEGR